MTDQPTTQPAPAAAPVPRLAQFIADVATIRDQIATVDPAAFATVADLATWIRSQLVDNVAELLVSLTNAISADVVSYVNDLGTLVQQMQDEEDEVLTSESAEILVGALDAGELVCRLAAKVIPKADQITAAKLQQAIGAFRARAVDAKTLIDEIVDVEADAEPADAPAPEPPGDGDGDGGGG